MMVPKSLFAGNDIDPAHALVGGMDVALKKQLADVALNAARAKGATYADVRIGRYLNQFILPAKKGASQSPTPNLLAWASALLPTVAGALPLPITLPGGYYQNGRKSRGRCQSQCKDYDRACAAGSAKGYGDVNWKTPIEQKCLFCSRKR